MDAQDFRSLQEAYMKVVENQQLDEELTGARKKRALEKGGYLANRVASGKEGQPVERRDPSGNVTMRTTTKAPTKRGGEEDKGQRKTDWPGYEADRGSGNKAKRRAAELNKEQTDIYDIILSHLLDEGYAETPEAAEVIMVNMSEEWRDDIMEGYKRYPAKKVGNKLDRMYDDPDTDTRFGKTGKRYSQMRTVDSHMKGEVHSLIRAHSPKKSKAKETENRKRGENG